MHKLSGDLWCRHSPHLVTFHEPGHSSCHFPNGRSLPRPRLRTGSHWFPLVVGLEMPQHSEGSSGRHMAVHQPHPHPGSYCALGDGTGEGAARRCTPRFCFRASCSFGFTSWVIAAGLDQRECDVHCLFGLKRTSSAGTAETSPSLAAD